ncbi:Lrp/AsnC family transcriptional regulator [Candidatus Micrarchaeota archaeon]|nr:Lrp/AsnC family transcriptional regulator [Candidatus Micrarchaeota archaeon]
MDERLDEKDLALIEELRKDSRLSEKRLAGKTSIPMTTVHNRLRRLRGLGVITGSTIRLDYAKLGRPLTAYVLLKGAPGADRKIMLSHVSSIPGVSEAAVVAGAEPDIIFKIRAASIEELNAVVVEDLRRQKTISDARLMVCYERIENE